MTPQEMSEAVHEILLWLRSNIEKEAQAKDEHFQAIRRLEGELSSAKAKAETYEKEWKKALEQIQSLQAHVAVAQDRLETLMGQLDQERRAREELSRSLAQAEKVIASLRENLEHSRRFSKVLQADKDILESTVKSLRQNIATLEVHIQDLYDSYSWKCTKPLRWAYSLLLAAYTYVNKSIYHITSKVLFRIHKVFTALLSFLQRHRWLYCAVEKIVHRFPRLARWGQRLLARSRSWADGADPAQATLSLPLSPRARFIAQQLNLAIQCDET